MPTHTHPVSVSGGAGTSTNRASGGMSGTLIGSVTSGISGGAYINGDFGTKPHPNMPPYYVLAYIMKI